jgi:uncharacterized protein YndB with AHSA1/START domain
MNKDLKMEVEFIYDSTTDTIWEYMTNPDLVKEYFFGTDLNIDLQAGGAIRYSGIYDDKEYVDAGIITKCEKPNLLEFTYRSSWWNLEDKPENYALITYKIEAIENSKTKLIITMQGHESKAKLEESEESWTYIMNEINNLITKKI